ncbi:MAG: D-alanine--D-alanine ligase family protein, partial [Acidimicrobiales bacterium]
MSRTSSGNPVSAVGVGGSRTGVVFGGPSPEHDVSILTGLQAAHELSRAGAEVFGLYWSKRGVFHRVDASLEAQDFLEGVPRGAEELRLVASSGGGFETSSRLGRARRLPVDVILNCCHGGPGEDGSLQAALDLAGLPYTGPSAAGAAVGMDKLAFAGVVAAAGLPLLPRALLDVDTRDLPFGGPYILKPRFGGSSLGVEVVEDLATAVARLAVNVHLRNGAVIEPYRGDLFDLNVAVRSWPQLAVSAVERPLRSGPSNEILQYSDKYVGSEGMASAPRELPAALPDALGKSIRDAALEVSLLCEVRGVARVDFLSDGDSMYVNEVNTVPGSLARYLWV